MDRIMFVSVTMRSGTQVSKTVKGEYVLSEIVTELIGTGNMELVANIVEIEIMPQCRMAVTI